MEKVTGLSHITFLNVRLHTKNEAAQMTFFRISGDQTESANTLMLAARNREDDVLRDLIRQLSAGDAAATRNESGGCGTSVPRLPHATWEFRRTIPRTDVLDGCKKTEGIRCSCSSVAADSGGG